jgi:hypothetical protein
MHELDVDHTCLVLVFSKTRTRREFLPILDSLIFDGAEHLGFAVIQVQ